jgi:hypothetical protein
MNVVNTFYGIDAAPQTKGARNPANLKQSG